MTAMFAKLVDGAWWVGYNDCMGGGFEKVKGPFATKTQADEWMEGR